MAPRTKLIRRAPLAERIKAYLNPYDFGLWLAEEVNSNELRDALEQWATPLGLLLNLLFMVARANSSSGATRSADDVFADYYDRRGSGWLAWFASFVVHLLTLASVSNAVYTFTRKRHYRLFESPLENVPSTPSARRVRVDSSPMASSPLRYFSNMMAASGAASRAHPDVSRDVWEVAVWDPTPICLRLFCLFSPGHVLVYWMFLPLAPLDPRPSVTVVTTITLALLLSVQMFLLRTSFSQQSKDSALINKEVLHEYDTKFVHPSLNKQVRDVSTQTSSKATPDRQASREVHTYSPTTFVNRGFHINPNPNYAAQFDPDGSLNDPSPNPRRTPISIQPRRTVTTPSDLHSPNLASAASETEPPSSSPLRSRPIFPPPEPRPIPPPASASRPVQGREERGDGGSFGIRTHAYSPLRRGTPAPNRPASPSKKPLRASSPGKVHSAPNLTADTQSQSQSQSAAALHRRYAQLRGPGGSGEEDRRWRGAG